GAGHGERHRSNRKKTEQRTKEDFFDKMTPVEALELSETQQITRDMVLELAGIPIPEDYGGAGADTLSMAIALEEIAKACGSTCLTLAAHTSLGTMPIFLFGSEELKQKYVPSNA